jgi:O-antigen/teichoic acid export membrane protein
MGKQNLKDKTVKGVAWSGIDNVAQIGVSFIVGIVLARLLTPDDYGLIGIIAIFTNVCTALINGGFTNALIRKKNITDDDYNTAFIVNLCMSLLLYFVVFLCAPFIAYFFNHNELITLTRVSCVGMIIGAFAIVQQARLTKRIDFKSQTKITVLSSVVSGLIGIIMALLGFGVWSLVFQQLISQSLRTILLWIANHWSPQLRFSTRSFRDLFGFGWKVMMVTIINTVWNELFQVVVGKFYSPATLGQYTRAKQFASLFSSNLTNVVQRVSFPVLSEIQDDKALLMNAYRRIIKLTMLVTVISMFALGAVSEPLIFSLIGEKWHSAAVYLPFICVSMSLYPLHAINLNMLQVQGRSDLLLNLEVVKKIIAIAPLVVGAVVGIIPMLLVNILASIISFFLNSYYTGRLIGYSSWMQLRDVASSYFIGVIVSISVYFLKYLPLSSWTILLLQFLIGACVFYGICRATKSEEFYEIVGILKTYLNKRR